MELERVHEIEQAVDADLSKKERRGLKRVYRYELVKRSALLKIVAAWIITVPVSGLMAAMLFFYASRHDAALIAR